MLTKVTLQQRLEERGSIEFPTICRALEYLNILIYVVDVLLLSGNK